MNSPTCRCLCGPSACLHKTWDSRHRLRVVLSRKWCKMKSVLCTKVCVLQVPKAPTECFLWLVEGQSAQDPTCHPPLRGPVSPQNMGLSPSNEGYIRQSIVQNEIGLLHKSVPTTFSEITHGVLILASRGSGGHNKDWSSRSAEGRRCDHGGGWLASPFEPRVRLRPPLCGGKGSKGRAANGDRPVGAASCRRDHHTMASCQSPPSSLHAQCLDRPT